ncbi:hypothetical protein ACRASX_11115 [Flavobacterium sp. TMP13]|uniref:hypothetical protein n=1 Tax=Flavobacterium sp. TMP13 TaxID=3425950 RepID=UPI003D782A9B
MKNIYELKLMEETFQDREQYSQSALSVRRVPGGWIFTDFEDSPEDNATQARLSSVFVPYNEEFHPSVDKRDEGF